MSKITSVIRRGYWICPACKHKNPGNLELCESCGHTLEIKEGEPSPFFLDETSQEVNQINELREAHSGADWICDYCNTANDGLAKSCKQCGSGRQQKLEKAPEQKLPPKKRSVSKILIGSGIALIALILLLAIPLYDPVKITGFSWERNIEIEYSRIVTEEGWELPTGGTLLKTETRFSHNQDVLDHYDRVEVKKSREVEDGYTTETYTEYEDVQVGTETVKTGTRDLGNGYFEDVYEERPVYERKAVQQTRQVPKYRTEYYTEIEEVPVYRQEPVYKTWYTYDILRWFHQRLEKTTGNSKEGVEWPAYTLAGNERAGTKTEIYTVFLISDDKKQLPFQYSCSFEEWQQYQKDDVWKADIREGKVYRMVKKKE